MVDISDLDSTEKNILELFRAETILLKQWKKLQSYFARQIQLKTQKFPIILGFLHISPKVLRHRERNQLVWRWLLECTEEPMSWFGRITEACA
ncbi:hypothetical protein MKW98_027063 [Papaver atlanticum]|uniref:Uncharacterized protein n=1 Tax=Papaver atlanticum TaxID=357466 RepID=A0AAD4RXB1_9MAGN|nr:hypothetical protein MKW98_027063 [Papaver atlanticum]